MARRVVLAAVAAAVAALSVLAASGTASAASHPTIAPGQRLSIAVRLEASGRDSIVVCQDHAFGQDGKPLGEQIATALAIASPAIHADPADSCLTIEPIGALTGPGSGHARIYRVNTATIGSVVSPLGYQQSIFIVCLPPLSATYHVFSGAAPASADGCAFKGIGWDLARPVDAEIAFNATSHDTARGFGAAAAWVIALGLFLLIVANSGSRVRMPTFEARPWSGVVAAGIVAGGTVFGWTWIAYRSGLIAMLQLRSSIGQIGEQLVLWIPSALWFGLTALAAWKMAKDVRRSSAAARRAPEGTTPFAGTIPPYWPPAPRPSLSALWTLAPQLSFLVAFLILAASPRGDEVRIEGMLAASVAYLLIVPFFAEGMLPAAYGARLMAPERAARIVDDLAKQGSRVRQVWECPVPPASFPIGSAIVRAGRRAMVWSPLAALEDAELAGAIALRSPRRRSWPVAAAGVVISIAFLLVGRAQSGVHIPIEVTAIAVAAVLAAALMDLFETIRVRTAERGGERAEAHLRGMLSAARATARLAAGGELGTSEVQMPSVAEGMWRRAERLARRTSRLAGLGDASVDAAIASLVAAERPVSSMAAAAAPEPSPPVPPAAKKRPAAPQKKRAASTKKAAAPKKPPVKKKSARASGRAPARSSRRSRP